MSTPDPTPQTFHAPALDGSLRVLILPLQKEAPARTESVDVDELLPAHLLPAQFASLGSTLRHLDIGFGVPMLLATRVFPMPGQHGLLTFGRSRATVDDAIARDEDPMDIIEVADPSVCFSLWATRSGVVLTVESLGRRGLSDGLRLPGSPEPDFTVDADIRSALGRALADAGLPRHATLGDLLGPQGAAVDAAQPVVTLLRASVERIRNRPLASGAYVVIESEATSKVKGLLEAPTGDDFDSLFHNQTTGAPRTWVPLPLADFPAQEAAWSALRADGRVALINLESMSVWHDYVGHGEGTVLAALPVLAHVADTESDYLALEEVALHPDEHSLDGQLALVHAIRQRRLRRTVERRRATPELFAGWTQPTTFATALLAARAVRLQEQDNDLEQLAAVVADGLEVARTAERERRAAQARVEEARRLARERKIDRLVALVSPVAGLAVIAGIFAAFASVPDDAKSAVLLGTSGAFVTTLVVTIIGIGIGAAILWYGKDRRKPPLRHDSGE